MFYSQPLATRFGTDLIGHITSGKWSRLDIAVAWVRASAISHLAPSLTEFLKAGNKLKVVVGVDLDNTTKEGLEAMLGLAPHGDVSVVIHHNEAGTIFHPKLYLFRNAKRATIIVGSNNVTEAGLYRNTEAGLEIEADVGSSIISSAVNALDAWSDMSGGLARQLDVAFLAELVANGYVKGEAAVRAEMQARRAAAKPKNGAGEKLFGSVAIAAPALLAKASVGGISLSGSAKSPAPSASKTLPANAAGQVLLMRVRKARGTQVQIPLAVMRTPFFKGASQVFSVASNITRGIHATHAARAGADSNPNTLKLEMPETASMADPVARFERTATGIQYEVYDRTSAKGSAIMQALEQGRVSKPASTTLTVPSSPASSTWWRFI